MKPINGNVMEISVYIATSLDGFIARENGALDWLPGSDGAGNDPEDYGYRAFMDTVDAIVMGRRTYEMVQAFGKWPYGSTPVTILSETLTALDPGLPPSVSLRNTTPEKLCEELDTAGIGHLYVDGGVTIRKFLDAGLVNKIIITRVPILLGSGIPLFGPLQKDIPLEHVKTLAFHNGFVQSHYRLPQ